MTTEKKKVAESTKNQILCTSISQYLHESYTVYNKLQVFVILNPGNLAEPLSVNELAQSWKENTLKYEEILTEHKYLPSYTKILLPTSIISISTVV